MSKAPLVIGALVVLAAGVVLVIMLGGDGPEVTATAQPGEPERPSAPPVGERAQGITVTDVPRTPDSPPTLADEGGEHPREYAVGDVLVRDHRAGNNPPLDIPPNVHPAEGRLLPSNLTHAISTKVKANIPDCIASLPAEGRGPKPRLEGQIVVAIKNEQLSVTEATMRLRDFDGIDAAALDAARQCIETRAIGLATAAADQADLEKYSINLTYGFPRR